MDYCSYTMTSTLESFRPLVGAGDGRGWVRYQLGNLGLVGAVLVGARCGMVGFGKNWV